MGGISSSHEERDLDLFLAKLLGNGILREIRFIPRRAGLVLCSEELGCAHSAKYPTDGMNYLMETQRRIWPCGRQLHVIKSPIGGLILDPESPFGKERTSARREIHAEILRSAERNPFQILMIENHFPSHEAELAEIDFPEVVRSTFRACAYTHRELRLEPMGMILVSRDGGRQRTFELDRKNFDKHFHYL
jgi:hypothetical protein